MKELWPRRVLLGIGVVFLAEGLIGGFFSAVIAGVCENRCPRDGQYRAFFLLWILGLACSAFEMTAAWERRYAQAGMWVLLTQLLYVGQLSAISP